MKNKMVTVQIFLAWWRCINNHSNFTRKFCIVTSEIIPWGRDHFVKVVVTRQVKTFPACYGTRSFVAWYQEPTHLTILVPDPVHIFKYNFSKIYFNIMLPPRLGHQSSLLLSYFQTSFLCHILSMRVTWHANPILFIWSFW